MDMMQNTDLQLYKGWIQLHMNYSYSLNYTPNMVKNMQYILSVH